MEIDLELYRRDVRVSLNPEVSLSAIDISPDFPLHTVLFLHGFGGQARQWRYQLREFYIRNRVIALDLRGHGHSDRPAGGYSMDRILDDVVSALDVLGVTGQITLVAHSFGGAIATEFAVRYPERVLNLILIATSGEFHLNRTYRMLLNIPATALRGLTIPTSGWLGAPPDILRAWYQNCLKTWRGWDLFGRINVPTLVIRGHQDRVFQKRYFEGVTQAIPGAVEVNMGYSGHMVMIERRDAVNREIERYLNNMQRTWRVDQLENPREELIRARPWLNQYDENVPFTVAIPAVTVPSLLRSAARRFPKRTAVIHYEQRINYQKLEKEVNRFANGLKALGLGKGERVLILLPNHPALVIAFYAILNAGGVVVFSAPDTSEDELIRQIGETDTRFVITLVENAILIARARQLGILKHIVLVDRTGNVPLTQRFSQRLSDRAQEKAREELLRYGVMVTMRDILDAFPDTAQTELPGIQDLAIISYTGGTTAAPKGVMLTHKNLVANTIQVRHWIPEAREGEEVFLCALAISHSYGFTTTLNLPISLGATLVLKDRFEVDDILMTIRKQRPTIFPGVPGMYMAIINSPNARNVGIDSIKACISGSAPLPVEVQEAFERLTRGRLVEGYGMTEASPVTHANPLNGAKRVGSIGVPIPSTEARIVDLVKGKRVVPDGQIGELAVRGPQVMQGYWNDGAGTEAVLSRDGWLLTGDVAQMDASGFFHLIARKADMWYPTKPGEPAFPRDVEEVIYEIPQVREVAVVAIAGQPVAFVITGKERPTKEAVISYCKRRLPPELVPKIVIFLDDFPRTFIGKVLRRELARRFLETNPAS
jgi:long-chain acyl-CoA synthetase